MTVLNFGTGVLDRLQVLRFAPTPLRGAPAATWTRSARTGSEQLLVAGKGLQPGLHSATRTNINAADSTLGTLEIGPKDGVHLNRHGAHTAFEIHLHIVWITKYRKAVMSGEVAVRAREIIRQVCREEDVEILKGHLSRDHVHLMVSIPPQVTISRLVQRMKGKSSYKLLSEFAHMRKVYWGRHVWARGYFCCSTGNVTDEMVKEYIANQRHEDDKDFQVEGDS